MSWYDYLIINANDHLLRMDFSQDPKGQVPSHATKNVVPQDVYRNRLGYNALSPPELCQKSFV
ncbi:hypothetical protein [Salipaludibacillus neizhouensis]|uniref:hypothetical protein n=1 Tax=Salipaludibacillus neizhouensis TaxID=885475 RepID=UPI0011C3CD69|nr:hypothetical protein [Salipaludibacillus neizhouensis]